MPNTTLSSREFNQHVSMAKRKANEGPVIVTDRGHPSHVLLSWDQYQTLIHGKRSIVDALAMNAEDALQIEFEIERSKDKPSIVNFD
ncbi:type II toxin-antitoxin system Phd/YefM family antitoxin [Luteithermobacter gelatinilyticus]|uniref:type II toxin-antitoxin system Phd/YefM family antitoxin n=1 Tax=Luteithermobacter gelatinilyticus TaxID=2582913 RepID=UPI0011057C97|nr:type II toxin-antitoxin system Phd/YefM family antitoxin [Luteithermobacter gelatinilyticus]